MEYTKQEMLDVLKRHEGTDPECDCACPLSGHSTEMLIRFVGVQNEIPNRLIECAIILLRQFNQKQCLMGVSRFSIAAGIIYLAQFISGISFYTQHELARDVFDISPLTIRNYYRIIFESFDKEFIQELVEKYRSYGSFKFLKGNLAKGKKIGRSIHQRQKEWLEKNLHSSLGTYKQKNSKKSYHERIKKISILCSRKMDRNSRNYR